MNPAILGLGASVVGDILGGNSRAERANSVARRLKELRERDQAEALRLAREDEARMAENHAKAVGYDLARLREEATAAGFNPLTVLQMTGAANYANTAPPVVTSPFISRVDAVMPAQMAKIDNAGYFGDAISRAGSGFIGISQESARLAADREIAAAMREPVRVGGGFPETARQVDARPAAALPGLPGWAGAIAKFFVPQGFPGRGTDVRDMQDETDEMVVTDRFGNKARGLNNQIFEEGIFSWVNQAGILAQLGAKQIMRAVVSEATADENSVTGWIGRNTPQGSGAPVNPYPYRGADFANPFAPRSQVKPSWPW